MKNVMEKSRAEEIAREIYRLEAILKQLKDELKEIVQTSGPINVDGKIWDFYPAVSWKFSPEQLKSFVEALSLDGHDPWKVLDVSTTEIKKLGIDEDVLSRYAEKKISLRFFAKAEK